MAELPGRPNLPGGRSLFSMRVHFTDANTGTVVGFDNGGNPHPGDNPENN